MSLRKAEIAEFSANIAGPPPSVFISPHSVPSGMQPTLLDFEPLPNFTYGSQFVVRWRLGGRSEGTMKVMISPVQQGCPPLKLELGNDIDIHAKDIHIPPMEIGPGLYIIEAVNQTNQAHILATSHSFHVFAPRTETETNQMGAIPHMSNTLSPVPSCACDSAPGRVTAMSNGELRAIVGAVLAIGLPCLITLSLILWKMYRPHHSRSKDRPPPLTPFNYPSSLSPHTGSPSKSLKSKSNWNSPTCGSTRSCTSLSSTSPATIRPPSVRLSPSLRISQGYMPCSFSCSPLLGSSGNIIGAGSGPSSVRSLDTSAGQCIPSPPPPKYSPC